jgi:alpha-L-arabinofuranosidase
MIFSNKIRFSIILFILMQLQLLSSVYAQLADSGTIPVISIYPDSVLKDVSNKPLGINLDYFMDNDSYLKPKRRLADALKAMGVKYLRYPGGNKSDFYFFSKPPYERSIPTLARTGRDAVGGRNRALNSTATGFKNAVLDFDQFMDLCHEIGAEPVIVVAGDEYLVNYPKGSAWSTREQLLKNAVEWVRYANIKKKYHVKYWMIANESWGPENKNSNVEIYAKDVIDFSKGMKAVDSTIKIIPNGNGELWWKTILTKTGDYIDDLCLSNYPLYGLKKGFYSYRDTVQNFIPQVDAAVKAINKYADAKTKRKLKIIVAEYGPFNWTNWPLINNMGYNMANFEITGEQLKRPEIEFSCFWNTRWIENDSVKYSVFDALDRDGAFNANGTGIMIWGKFLLNKMVRSTSTVHLRTFATYSPDHKNLVVYFLNKANTPVTIEPKIANYKVGEARQLGELTSTGPDDVNPIWTEQEVLTPGNKLNVQANSIKVVQYRLL